MEDKVLCPYCGSEMRLPTITDARWVIDKAHLYKGNMTCTNPDCAAVSPTLYGYDLPKLAEQITEAALKRFKPLQKPMTFEEVCKMENDEGGNYPVQLLYRDGTTMWALKYTLFKNLDMTNPDTIEQIRNVYGKQYLIYRNATSPEERQAAEWDTTQK